jgi:hypothetical protein
MERGETCIKFFQKGFGILQWYWMVSIANIGCSFLPGCSFGAEMYVDFIRAFFTKYFYG